MEEPQIHIQQDQAYNRHPDREKYQSLEQHGLEPDTLFWRDLVVPFRVIMQHIEHYHR